MSKFDKLFESLQNLNADFDVNNHHDTEIFSIMNLSLEEVQAILPREISATEKHDGSESWINVEIAHDEETFHKAAETRIIRFQDEQFDEWHVTLEFSDDELKLIFQTEHDDENESWISIDLETGEILDEQTAECDPLSMCTENMKTVGSKITAIFEIAMIQIGELQNPWIKK